MTIVLAVEKLANVNGRRIIERQGNQQIKSDFNSGYQNAELTRLG